MFETLLAGVMFAVQSMPAEAPYSHPHVKQVTCNTVRGTAWRMSQGRFATVAHVSDHSGCAIEGRLMEIEYIDPDGDFSIVRTDDPTEGGIEIDCGGYRAGTWYHAVGFARGDPWSVTIPISASLIPNLVSLIHGWQLLMGFEYVIPGMSGGPVLDGMTGHAVGMVNAYNDKLSASWSRSLKDTILCQI